MILELGQGCEGLLGLCSEASHCIIGLMDHKAVFGAALGGFRLSYCSRAGRSLRTTAPLAPLLGLPELDPFFQPA